jgi:TusA-related sulfurtransferase
MNTANAAARFLDITGEVCPMTFVKTRLLIERMAPGEVAEVRLTGEEPLKNVPESVAELGHTILSLAPEAGEPSNPRAIWRLKVRKA